MKRKKNISHLMIIGNIIQEANKGEVHSPENNDSAENLTTTYSTLVSMEKELKSKRMLVDEDYAILSVVEKAKNLLLQLVSRNLTTWDRNRHFNLMIPEFKRNYGMNRDVYESISGETYIFCRVSNRLNGVELATVL